MRSRPPHETSWLDGAPVVNEKDHPETVNEPKNSDEATVIKGKDHSETMVNERRNRDETTITKKGIIRAH